MIFLVKYISLLALVMNCTSERGETYFLYVLESGGISSALEKGGGPKGSLGGPNQIVVKEKEVWF